MSGLVCTHLSDHLPVFQIKTNVKTRDNDKDETKQYRQINEQTLNVLNHELEKRVGKTFIMRPIPKLPKFYFLINSQKHLIKVYQ